MDQELAAYLDGRFEGLDQRFEAARRHAEALATETRQYSEALATETRQHSEALATETRQHSEGLATETRQHSEGLATETRRHFDVVAEALRGDIRVVAEGHLDLSRQIQEMRREQESAQREVLAAIKFSYAELDRRITRLESVTADLDGRVARLESGGE